MLYHEEGMSQGEISQRLNLSQARVSRYLKAAVELGMRLGSSAATYLETTIDADVYVGISSWSTTLLHTVEAMRSRPRKIANEVIRLIGGVAARKHRYRPRVSSRTSRN